MRELTQAEVCQIVDQTVREITEPMTPLYTCLGAESLSPESCTIQTTFEGGYRACLTLCADTALLIRLAKETLEEETVSQADLEDFAKEYFNVICGRIAARLFQTARISSRFHIPSFRLGPRGPDQEDGGGHVLRYASGQNERIQVIHQSPSALSRTM